MASSSARPCARRACRFCLRVRGGGEEGEDERVEEEVDGVEDCNFFETFCLSGGLKSFFPSTAVEIADEFLEVRTCVILTRRGRGGCDF